jgi:serine/threonine protein kinase
MAYNNNSTMSTQALTLNEKMQENHNPRDASNLIEGQNTLNDDKNYFCKKENMLKYINDNYPQFNEQFELLNYVNRGSSGYVYEGKKKSEKNNIKLAIKFSIKKQNKYHEIGILKKLNHKNINRIYACLKINDDSIISVQEFIKFRHLNYFVNILLKKKKLSETCILYFAKQILDSLAYLHLNKIVHMDIKPENILIDEQLNPRLIDFSDSCVLTEFHPEDLVKFPFRGTSVYMAPEIIKRKKMKIIYSQKIDIYSFGATLYYLHFGIYPYDLNKVKDKHDYKQILEKIEKEKLEFPNDIKASDMFKDFLTKLLEKDYIKRFSIKEALMHPWIQAWQILEDEKQNISCLENFLIKLVSDSVPKLNVFINLN